MGGPRAWGRQIGLHLHVFDVLESTVESEIPSFDKYWPIRDATMLFETTR